MEDPAEHRVADGFAAVYGADLLCEGEPRIDRAELLASLRRHCGRVVELSRGEAPLILHYAFEDHPAPFTDAEVPVQALVDPTHGVPDDLEGALRQTWDWADAREVVARCRHGILVTDFLARTCPREERLALFRRTVLAVMEVAPCAAIRWRASGRVVEPEAFRRAMAPGSDDDVFPAINVRLFNVGNGAAGETVMDTLGLAALGVPDLQCHFQGLEPSRMAELLYDGAAYLFGRGDVIADGHTLQGFAPEQRWPCRHEDALVGPARVVLDLDPGPPHAAGRRHDDRATELFPTPAGGSIVG